MGRPQTFRDPAEYTTNVSARITVAELAAVDQAAEQRQQSRSAFVAEAIRRELGVTADA